MALQDNRFEPEDTSATEVLDRAYLYRNTMQNQSLAEEVLGLFLVQLPSMLDGLDGAVTPGEWAFATHTLKGSAAAIGARRLQFQAASLEAMAFPGDPNVRLLRLQAIRAAAAEFRQAVQDEAAPPPGTVVFPAPIS